MLETRVTATRKYIYIHEQWTGATKLKQQTTRRHQQPQQQQQTHTHWEEKKNAFTQLIRNWTRTRVCRMLNFLHSHANHPINTFIQLDKMKAELFELLPFMTCKTLYTHAYTHTSHRHELTHFSNTQGIFLYNYCVYTRESLRINFQQLDGNDEVFNRKWCFYSSSEYQK